ncbi:MAG: methylated-DNA--[protein]-cysteine S-methyltransferase, partial [Nitrospinae bacterium]|nr:methylated-DNA--[protein]-cysteine S-methyltransferase [Nitrospinota bacterium]
GKTQSYRMLAKAIGQPKAFRAVGNANGKNPLPLIIPCHRVIRENGDMGGYTGGLHLKRFLLDLERNN